MLVVSLNGYIFEKVCLVASQLPLTREPRKECGARDSVALIRVGGVVRVDIMREKKVRKFK